MDHSKGKSPNTLTLEEIHEKEFPEGKSQDEQVTEELTVDDCLPTDVQPSSVASSSKTKDVTEEDSKYPNLDEMAIVLREPGVEADINAEEQALVVGEDQVGLIKRVVSNYTLSARLYNWRIEERPRPNNTRIDKFYIHIASDIQFRSLNEVDDFVRLGLHPKRGPIRQRAMEGQLADDGPSKRSQKRTLGWTFEPKGFTNDGRTNLYDVNFVLQSVHHNPNSPNSSERTISDVGEEDDEVEQAVGDSKETMREKVEMFLKEAYENQMNLEKDAGRKDGKRKERKDDDNLETQSSKWPRI